jgi:hypothetical protein
MIFAIPMLASCISAAFFCYLIARTFSSLRNRACSIVCLGCPVLLAALLFAFSDALLNPLYESLQSLGRSHRHGLGSLTVIVASLLVVITLLIASLAAQILLLNRRGSG